MHPEQPRIQHVDCGRVLRSGYGTLTYPTTKPLAPFLEQHSITRNSVLRFFQIAETQTLCSRNTYLLYPSMSSRALPEAFLKSPKVVTTDTKQSTYKLSPKFRGYTLATYSNTTQLCEVTTGYKQLTIYSKY